MRLILTRVQLLIILQAESSDPFQDTPPGAPEDDYDSLLDLITDFGKKPAADDNVTYEAERTPRVEGRIMEMRHRVARVSERAKANKLKRQAEGWSNPNKTPKSGT